MPSMEFENKDSCGSEFTDYHSLLTACTEYSPQDYEIQELLVVHGVHIDSRGPDDKTVLMTLCCTDDIDTIDILIKLGANVNAVDVNGSNALLNACENGHFDVVKLLIHHGSDVNSIDINGNTPLSYACDSRNNAMVCILIDDININPTKNHIDAVKLFQYAFEIGLRNALSLLLKHGFDFDTVVNEMAVERRLRLAFEFNEIDMVRFLVDNWKNCELISSLSNNETLRNACAKGYPEIVQFLLDKGLETNGVHRDEYTPLIIAAQYGHNAVIKLLIERGACVDYANKRYGKTALMYACASWEKKAVDMLLHYGADINKTCHLGKNPFMYSCTYLGSDLVELFFDREYFKNRSKKSKTVFDYFLSWINWSVEESQLQKCDVFDKAAWIYLCENGHYDIVKDVIKHCGNINKRDSHGMTALMHTCHNKNPLQQREIGSNLPNFANYKEIDTYSKERLWRKNEVVHILINHGVNLDLQDDRGKTAIMYCIESGNPEALEMLITAGAKLGFCDKSNRHEFLVALEAFRDKKCLRMLLESGTLTINGRLKPILRHFPNGCYTYHVLCYLIELGIFEWELCNNIVLTHFFQLVLECALLYGVCPGKTLFANEFESPLIWVIKQHNNLARDTILKHSYFYPEDYKRLCSNEITSNMSNHQDNVLYHLTHNPMSLFTWSFITVSKLISLSGSPNRRRERVGTLHLPKSLRDALLFKIPNNRLVNIGTIAM